MESARHETFIRLAEERMSRIYQTANLLSNLSTFRYVYTKNEMEEFWNSYFENGKQIESLFKGGEEAAALSGKKLEFAFSTPGVKDEPKNETFRRLATLRMNKILSNLKLIGNLRNKKNYSYTPEEVDILFTAYREKGLEIKCFFDPHLEPLSDIFSFEDY